MNVDFISWEALIKILYSRILSHNDKSLITMAENFTLNYDCRTDPNVSLEKSMNCVNCIKLQHVLITAAINELETRKTEHEV